MELRLRNRIAWRCIAWLLGVILYIYTSMDISPYKKGNVPTIFSQIFAAQTAQQANHPVVRPDLHVLSPIKSKLRSGQPCGRDFVPEFNSGLEFVEVIKCSIGSPRRDSTGWPLFAITRTTPTTSPPRHSCQPAPPTCQTASPSSYPQTAPQSPPNYPTPSPPCSPPA